MGSTVLKVNLRFLPKETALLINNVGLIQMDCEITVHCLRNLN